MGYALGAAEVTDSNWLPGWNCKQVIPSELSSIVERLDNFDTAWAGAGP